MNPARNQRLARILLATYCCIIFVLSHQPSALPETDWLEVDKLAHFAAYGLLATLAWLAQTDAPSDTRLLGQRVLVAFGFAVLFGISDEFHQSFIPQRMASFADLVADTIGAAIGVFLCWHLRRSQLWPHISRPPAASTAAPSEALPSHAIRENHE